MSRKAKPRAGLTPALLAAAALTLVVAAAFSRAPFLSRGGPAADERVAITRVAASSPRPHSGQSEVPSPFSPSAIPTNEALRDWAIHLPREAWPWIRENSARLSPSDEPSLIAVFFRHLAARDPGAVIAFAGESIARADGAVIAAAAINALLENNWPDLARRQVEAWANDPNPPAIGVAPFQAVAWQLARESDRAAADWLAGLPGSAGRDAAFAGTAAGWAEHDPPAAMGWASGLPAGDARTSALDRTFRIWADHDSTGAADWLLEHESGPEADRLIGAWLAASPVAAENPRLALQWVALIRDEPARRRSQDLILAGWRGRDAAAADHFAANPP